MYMCRFRRRLGVAVGGTARAVCVTAESNEGGNGCANGENCAWMQQGMNMKEGERVVAAVTWLASNAAVFQHGMGSNRTQRVPKVPTVPSRQELQLAKAQWEYARTESRGSTVRQGASERARTRTWKSVVAMGARRSRGNSPGNGGCSLSGTKPQPIECIRLRQNRKHPS